MECIAEGIIYFPATLLSYYSYRNLRCPEQGRV